MADPIPLPELVERMNALAGLSDEDAVKAAAELLPVAKATLQAYADERAYSASRRQPNAEAAAAMEIEVSTLENRIKRHRKRMREGRSSQT